VTTLAHAAGDGGFPNGAIGRYSLALTRYCHHQYCKVCGIKKGVGKGGILRNGGAIVLQ